MKFHQKQWIVIFILLLATKVNYAQQVGAKDCFDAIQLPNNNTLTFINSAGEGIYTDEIDGSSSCLSEERNSAWFEFNVASSGLLYFNLIPQCTDFLDLDWAVYDITNGGCEAINFLSEVSCNFSGNPFPPITGANGGDGTQDEPPIFVSGGMTLVLLVNNFSGDIDNCEYSIDLSNNTVQLGLQNTEQLEMNVSPNPSTGMISLNFTEKWQGLPKTIQVSDLSGRIIKTIETSEPTPNFNWNELPQGTYIISVRMKNGLVASARWTKI